MSPRDDELEKRLRDVEDKGIRFEERWKRVDALLTKIDVGVNGDEESPGLKGRVDRIEQKQKTLARLGGAVLAVVSTLAAVLGLRHL